MANKKTRIAINGFGRIGRAAFKILADQKGSEVVAVNDLADTESIAHLLRYDTVYGRLIRHKVRFTKSTLVLDGRSIPVFKEQELANLPWKELQVDVVLECTGHFTKNGSAAGHVKAGARRVVISAPAKGGNVPTYLLGVNDTKYRREKVISNASCTTNCVAPVAKVITKAFGVKRAAMTTVHSYTAEQNLVDGLPPALHKDLRRARAAAQNIVPTTSGAAISTTEVLPELKNRFDGFALRVPTPIVSITDFTFVVKKPATVERVNAAFVKASKESSYKNVLAVTKDPVVSSDFIGDPHSAIVDLSLTNVIGGDLVKVIAWYDNEWGYANRLVEMAELVGKSIR